MTVSLRHAPPLLRIAVCGRLWVEAGSVRVLERDFPARQGRRLWSYLVLEQRRMVSRDELAEVLRGETKCPMAGIRL